MLFQECSVLRRWSVVDLHLKNEKQSCQRFIYCPSRQQAIVERSLERKTAWFVKNVCVNSNRDDDAHHHHRSSWLPAHGRPLAQSRVPCSCAAAVSVAHCWRPAPEECPALHGGVAKSICVVCGPAGPTVTHSHSLLLFCGSGVEQLRHGGGWLLC